MVATDIQWHNYVCKCLYLSFIRFLLISFVVHATLCMMTAEENPPTKDTPEGLSMNCFGLMDCTSRLKEPYSSREGYPGYVIGTSYLQFPVSLFQNKDGSVAALDKPTFVKTLRYSRELFTQQKNDPGVLSTMAQAAELLSFALKAAFAADACVVSFFASFRSIILEF